MKSKEEILDYVTGWAHSKNQDVFVSTPHALKAMERYAIEKQIEALTAIRAYSFDLSCNEVVSTEYIDKSISELNTKLKSL